MDSIHTAEYRAFRLATELIEFSHYARNNWCSWEHEDSRRADLTISEKHRLPDVLFAKLEFSQMLLARLSASVVFQDRDQGLVQRARQGLTNWFDLFRREFRSESRLSKIQQLANIDSDPEWDATPFLLAGSPFEIWSMAGHVGLYLPLRSRAPSARAPLLFLSHVLYLECVYERITRRVESETEDPRDCLPKLLDGRLTLKIGRLAEEIPTLGGLASDFSIAAYWDSKSNAVHFGYRHWLREKLGSLHETINARLFEMSEDRLERMTKKPSWDPETRELCYDGKILKRLPARAKNQRRLLDEFEVLNWPLVIDDPLQPRSLDDEKRRDRLKHAIRGLNRRLPAAAGDKPSIEFKPAHNLKAISWRAT